MSSLSELFSAGSRRYDLLVSLNPGYHRHLLRAATRLVQRCRPTTVLDLGCGTGASTQAVLTAAPQARVVGVDASPGMVEHARSKYWPVGQAEFRVGVAGDCAVTGDVAPFDGCLAAYLLRNVPAEERTDVLRAVHDQLRPGGVLVIQDWTSAGSPGARLVWDVVCWLVIIPLSAALLRDTRLYRYLWRSVRTMEPVERWCERLVEAGFDEIEIHPGTDWQRGLLHTVAARRP